MLDYCRLDIPINSCCTESSLGLQRGKLLNTRPLAKISYSAYIILWVFNFTNFANLESFAKFIQLKFEPCATTCMGDMHLQNFFNEFLQNSYSRKFRPAKYKHYTVDALTRPSTFSTLTLRSKRDRLGLDMICRCVQTMTGSFYLSDSSI